MASFACTHFLGTHFQMTFLVCFITMHHFQENTPTHQLPLLTALTCPHHQTQHALHNKTCVILKMLFLISLTIVDKTLAFLNNLISFHFQMIRTCSLRMCLCFLKGISLLYKIKEYKFYSCDSQFGVKRDNKGTICSW